MVVSDQSYDFLKTTEFLIELNVKSVISFHTEKRLPSFDVSEFGLLLVLKAGLFDNLTISMPN